MKLDIVAISDVGKIRQNNEDNYYVQGKIRQDLTLLKSRCEYVGDDEKYLLAVADGLGGEDNGEVASLVVMQSLRTAPVDLVQTIARESIEDANEMICDEIKATGKRMGSTLAALYISDDKAIGCNIGDSRIYMMRDDSLVQLSKDHTVVQEMVDNGAIKKEEAREHRKRHILTQNIGIFPEELIIEPCFTEIISLNKEDIFLICSDGLTDMLTDEEIKDILKNRTVDSLVECALEKGGRDNVTVVVAKCVE